MNENKDKVIQLIQKLSEMRVDRGCTPSEAAHAAAKIEELLEQHQLSMFDVTSKTFDEKVVREELEVGRKIVPAWVHDLAGCIARPHDCEYFTSTFWKPKHLAKDDEDWRYHSVVKFIGHTSDAKVVRYLYEVLSRTLMEMADREGRRLGRTSHDLIRFKSNFVSAAAYEIRRRLMAERAKARQEAGSSSTALVEVKKHAVDQFMKEHHPNLKTIANSDRATDEDAIAQGIRAGRGVELRQGLEDESEKHEALELKDEVE